MAEPRSELFEYLRRQSSGAGDEEPHGGPDLAGLLRRNVEHPDVHRGHAEEQRGMEAEKLSGDLLIIETLHEAHAATAREPTMQPVAKPVYMKERQREQQAIGARYLPGVKKCDSVGREIVVCEHSALGSAGGPRC